MLTSYKGLDKQGKWVYGYYSERKGKSYINDVEVQKETVCTCTGKTDIDGNFVYENDILIDINDIKFDKNYKVRLDNVRYNLIRFNPEELRFVRVIYLESTQRYMEFNIYDHVFNTMKVVGNYFDNNNK
jgi:hypothetical protein